MLQTAVYLLCLACAIRFCYSQCASPLRLAASGACIAVTWFYIVRFMVYYEGPNAFDGAYADVVWGGIGGNWGLTQMLLTWAIVAMVWSHEAPCAFQIFGVFGAMSASFLVYKPADSPRAGVPLSYALSALVGFCCTWMLPRTTTLDSLSWWLWGLHAALLVPKFLPFGGPRVDAVVLQLLLAAMCLATHLLSTSSPWPKTDCQLSISIDMLVCSGVTLAYIKDNLKAPLPVMVLSAALVALASPGCVLALAVAVQHGLPRLAVSLVQKTMAQRCSAACKQDADAPRPSWMNLGYWKGHGKEPGEGDAGASDYVGACRALAGLVGKAAGLRAGERLLSVGCGSGEELRFFKEAHGLASATGLDAECAAAAGARGDEAVRLVQGLVEDMASVRKLGFRRGDFDKIVAVDSIYHCDKARFFADCAGLLPAGGVVAVSDVVVREAAPWWARLALLGMNIPWSNHWSQLEYERRLAESGLKLETVESLEPHVLARWFPAFLRRHLDYAVVTATVTNPRQRPTAAIVGSGMSGCLAGWRLCDTHDVTVFEAGPVVNLAGRSLTVDDTIVDVPLRMIAPHYYLRMMEAIKELEVPTKPTRFDVCIFDAARQLFVTHASSWKTFWERVGYCGLLLRLTMAMVFRPPPDRKMTFGAFMRLHDLADNEVYRLFILPQLSWMLSCDMPMVEGYPATAILAFIRSINPLLSFAKGIVRIYPCNKVIQDALTKRLDVRLDQCIGEIGDDRVICGQAFDVVVIATEAPAVPKILASRPWASVFAEFQYHPSSIILHHDPALMPREPESWRVLNVRVDEKEPACMLSVWMNAYYADDSVDSQKSPSPFQGHVIQSWNPHLRPKEDSIIQEAFFRRVVHTSDSHRLQQAVEELQGRDGLYFAGAYCVHGLGLLEEAIKSSEVAVKAILRDAAAAEGRRAAAGGPDAKC